MNGPTTRPATNWTFILTTVGGTLLLGFIFLKGFWFPYQKNLKDLVRLEDELETQEREYKTFMKDKKKLESYKLLGLPRNLEGGSLSYTEYLQNLLYECQFTGVDIKPSGHEAKPKAQAPGGAKKPGHLTLAFQVDAQGDWVSLTKMLEKFQRTPFLHRLRTLTIGLDTKGGGKAAKARLSFTMNIETLVVHKNEQRPDNLWGVDTRVLAWDSALALFGQPSAWATLLSGQALLATEMPPRRYADLAWVNPFVGGKPRPPDQQNPGKEEKKPPKRSEYRLVLTNPSDQKAILLTGSPEKNTIVKLASLETFTIFDGIDTLKGQVLRVDLREVYFRVGAAVYGIRFEENLTDAMKRPLSAVEQKTLGLVEAENDFGP